MNWRVKTGANAVLFGAVVFASIVVVNLLSTRLFKRIDLTEQKMYTLSKASKEVVATLPDHLTIKAFLSRHQELDYGARYVRDMLEEYANSSKGKLTWEALNPDEDEAAKQEATRMKVEAVRLQEVGAAKFSVQTAYLGIGLQYAGQVESIPVVNPNNLVGLEYELTSIIKRMAQRKRKIAFATGHGEPGTSAGLQALNQGLDHYEISSIDLKQNDVPEDVDLLMVVGPNEPFSERAKYRIDQHLMRGKSLAVLLDGMVMETPKGQMPPGQLTPEIARPNDVGLDDLLQHYGAKVERNIVLDEQNVPVFMQVGPGQVMPVNYPGYPIVTELDRDNPAVGKLRAVVPVFPSSVAISDGASTDGRVIRALAKTTDKSWKQTEIFLFDPNHEPKAAEERASYPIAVTIKGKLRSFFAGKPVPPPEGEAGKPEEPTESAAPEVASEAEARVVIVGDSEFIRDETVRKLRQAVSSNFVFMLNLIDWLAQDEALIGVRSKMEASRPLKQVDPDRITLIKYANTVGVPVALIILGIVRWRIRRARRARLTLE